MNPTPVDPNNPPTPEDVPVQSYAAIDVSGDTVSSDVNLLTLDDNNVVSFETSAGEYGPFSSYVWQNGVLGSPQVTPGTVDISPPGYNAPPYPAPLYPYFILPTGALIGICGYDSADLGAFYAVGGVVTPSYFPTYPNPFDPDMELTPTLVDVGPCAKNGTYTGNFFAFVPIPGTSYVSNVMFSFICVSGSYIAFDPTNELSLVDSGMTVVSDSPAFTGNGIEAVNSSGQALGYEDTSQTSVVYWNGTNMALVGSGHDPGLNEQGQAIVQGVGSIGNQAEGYLWENGTTTVLTNHLPAELQGQIAQIEPFSISNQTAPGTDATIYLLANALVNGAAATIVCTRDNDGDWSFAQIGLPSSVGSVNITAINSSGELAFTGYDDGSNDGSNQTSSTSIRVVRPAQASRGTPQPADTPSGNKKAYVAPMLDLKFNTTNPAAPDDKAWKQAQKAYDPKKPLQVGTGALFENPKTTSSRCGIPYEYIYKLDPDNTGATTTANAPSDMQIYELNSMHIQPMAAGVPVGTGTDQKITVDGTFTYNAKVSSPNSGGNVSFTTVKSPATPVMYAFDIPNIPTQEVYDIINNDPDDKLDSCLIIITLNSYPFFKQNPTPIDPKKDPGLEQKFWLNCKMGTPPIWTSSLDGKTWKPVQQYDGLTK